MPFEFYDLTGLDPRNSTFLIDILTNIWRANFTSTAATIIISIASCRQQRADNISAASRIFLEFLLTKPLTLSPCQFFRPTFGNFAIVLIILITIWCTASQIIICIGLCLLLLNGFCSIGKEKCNVEAQTWIYKYHIKAFV